MSGIKLLAVLKSMDTIESERFMTYLASDYFGAGEQERELYAHLQDLHRQAEKATDWVLNDKDRRNLFASMYPAKLYSSKKMTYLFSRLNKRAEQFLGIERILQQEHTLEITSLGALSERNLEKSYQHLRRQLTPKDLMNSQRLLSQQLDLLEVEEAHFARSRQRSFDLTIEKAADTLDRYYFMSRLSYTCAMLDRQAIFKDEYQLNISEPWLEHLRAYDCFDEPLIQLYYLILQTLQEEEEEEHFYRLKELLPSVNEGVLASDLKDIYLLVINYCARKIRQGKETYLREALALYRQGIEIEVLLEQGELSPWTFANVIKLSLRLEEFSEAAHFINRYGQLLPTEFRENALHYNLAELYYYTQQFTLAQTELLQVAYTDLNYYLGARVLLAKIYWEIGEEDPLLSLIASFTIFLKRNRRISNELKHTYLNFCQLLYKILRYGQVRKTKLEAELVSTKLLTDRAWLLEILKG